MILDGFAQTVRNPNFIPIFLDCFEPFRINRLDFVQNGFLPFLNALKSFKNCFFFHNYLKYIILVNIK